MVCLYMIRFYIYDTLLYISLTSLYMHSEIEREIFEWLSTVTPTPSLAQHTHHPLVQDTRSLPLAPLCCGGSTRRLALS